MKKALLIGLLVCVLALGAIGAAFATGMTNSGSNIGALSEGTFGVNQVNLTGMDFATGPDWTQLGTLQPICAQWVNLTFDRTLDEHATFTVQVYNASSTVIEMVYGEQIIPTATTLPAGTPMKFYLSSLGAGSWATAGWYGGTYGNVLPGQPNAQYYVYVPPSDGILGPAVSDIYGIRVTVQD